MEYIRFFNTYNIYGPLPGSWGAFFQLRHLELWNMPYLYGALPPEWQQSLGFPSLDTLIIGEGG